MSPSTASLVSIVVPAFNERENLSPLLVELSRVFQALEEDFELVVVDDGSSDGTLDLARKLGQNDPRVRYISFSRNFGHQAAVTAGLDHASGDAVVVMDADLQDPPALIPEMLDLWHEGHQVISARRTEREATPWSKRFFAWLYYRLLSLVSEVEIPMDTGDFCLMDRRVVDELNRLPERNRYIRGLRAWVGFDAAEVAFHRPARHAGRPKYNFFKSLALAIDGLISLSLSPLRLATYVGMLTGVLALLMVGLVIYWRFFTESSPLAGYAMITATILFVGSMQLIVIGITGEYLGRVYGEVKGRPLYIVRDTNVTDYPARRTTAETTPPASER